MNPLNLPSLDSYITDNSVIEALIKEQPQLKVLGSEGVKLLLLQFKSQRHAELIINSNLEITDDKQKLRYRFNLVKLFQGFISEPKNIKILLSKYLGFDGIFETIYPQYKEYKDQIIQCFWNDIQKGNIKLTAFKEPNAIQTFIGSNLIKMNLQNPKQNTSTNEQRNQEITSILQDVLQNGGNPRMKPHNASTTTTTTTTSGIPSPLQNPSRVLPINGQNFTPRHNNFLNETQLHHDNQIPPLQNRSLGNTQQNVNIISASNSQHFHQSMALNANTQRTNVDNGVATNLNRTSRVSTNIPFNINHLTQNQTAISPSNKIIPNVLYPNQNYTNTPPQIPHQQQGTNNSFGNNLNQTINGELNIPSQINLNRFPPTSNIPKINNPQFNNNLNNNNNNKPNNSNYNNNTIVSKENIDLLRSIHLQIQDFIEKNIDLNNDFALQPKLLSDIYEKVALYVQEDAKTDENYAKINLQQIDYDLYALDQTYLVLTFIYSNNSKNLMFDIIILIRDQQASFQLKRFLYMEIVPPDFMSGISDLGYMINIIKENMQNIRY